MSSLPDLIRADLQRQRTRWVWRYTETTLGDPNKAQTAYELSDLGACHQAINAILDEHQSQPCVFHVGEHHCATCRDVDGDCGTVRTIADALNIKPQGES